MAGRDGRHQRGIESAGQEHAVGHVVVGVLPDDDAQRFGGVTRGVEEGDLDPSDRDHVARRVLDEVVGADLGRLLDPLRLVGLDVDRAVDVLEQGADALDRVAHHRPADVVGVVVGGEHAADLHAVGAHVITADSALPPAAAEALMRRFASRADLGAGLGLLRLEPGAASGLSDAVVAAGLEVRPRTGGEEIKIAGQAHTKKLKKLLQEEGIVPWMRDRLPLLYSGGRLVAVAVQEYPHTKDWSWSVALIDDPDTVNAWCMAGGKMALYTGLIEKIGEPEGRIVHESAGDSAPAARHESLRAVPDHEAGFAVLLELLSGTGSPDAFGHRVVHGGETYRAPAPVDAAVIRAIREHEPLAPLHNPANLEGIRATMKTLPGKPQVAVAQFHGWDTRHPPAMIPVRHQADEASRIIQRRPKGWRGLWA